MSDPARGLSGRLALGRYRVVKELARGGMGMVYLGRVEGAAGFSKPVVIKRVLSHVDENKAARTQFIREARLLSELHHPNIVGVIDFGEEDEGYLMILEYVHGFHVGMWLRYVLDQGRRFHWEFAVLIVIRVLSALSYAHSRVGPDGKKSPIIHRDVSPGNILIDLEGNVRLLDFGIARTSDDDEAKTQNGVVKGKLPYIAPEIYKSAQASAVSDVYSTGVMLYQLLSGKNPFSAKDMSAIIGRVLDFNPPPISTLRPDLPPGLDEVLAKVLEKDPRRRYQSAQQLSNALSALLTCSDAELAGEMRAAVVIEFTDEMAQALGVSSLSTLDAAWRAAAEDPDLVESLQRSSLPPADETHSALTQPIPLDGRIPTSLHDEETLVAPLAARKHAEQMRVATQGAESPVSTGVHSVDTQLGIETQRGVDTERGIDSQQSLDSLRNVPTLEYAHATTAGKTRERTKGPESRAEPRSASPRSMLTILLAAGLVAGAVLGAAMLLRGSQPEPAPKSQRFLVVERPAGTPKEFNSPDIDATPNLLGEPKKANEKGSLTESPTPSPKAAQHAGPAQPASLQTDAQKVTAAFGARHGAVQSCFSQQASGITGAPQLTVHFKIAEDGAVQSASLAPAQVSGTALGACILTVAKGTKFPALGKQLGFSIPITAQVVQR